MPGTSGSSTDVNSFLHFYLNNYDSASGCPSGPLCLFYEISSSELLSLVWTRLIVGTPCGFSPPTGSLLRANATGPSNGIFLPLRDASTHSRLPRPYTVLHVHKRLAQALRCGVSSLCLLLSPSLFFFSPSQHENVSLGLFSNCRVSEPLRCSSCVCVRDAPESAKPESAGDAVYSPRPGSTSPGR